MNVYLRLTVLDLGVIKKPSRLFTPIAISDVQKGAAIPDVASECVNRAPRDCSKESVTVTRLFSTGFQIAIRR